MFRGPIHLPICAGSSQASNTRSRGASKLRVITNARSASAPGTGFRFCMDLSFRFGGARRGGRFEMFIEPVETLAPETTIEIEPGGGGFQAFRIEPAAAELAIALLPDEGRCFQHAQMTRNRRQGYGEGTRQFRYGRFAQCEALDNGAPRGIGKRRKGPVEAGG